jgi:hypothetical protein
MCYNKKALALWLGLFFFIIFSLAAQENAVPVSGEVSAETGTLWVDDEGAALYWNSGLSLNLGRHFFLDFNAGQVLSSLPWMDTSVFGIVGRFGIGMPNGDFTLASGFFKQSSLNAAIGKITLFNQGGDGLFINVVIPLHFGSLSVSPHFLYSNASWNEGDLYYFFGKPNISYLLFYGLDINYNYQERYIHGLSLRGLYANPEILNNENESIFNSHLNGGLFAYQFSMERSIIRFSGTAGWLFVNVSLDGALNTSNQPYFLFPYQFFNINAFTKIHAGFALLGFCHNWGSFRYNLKFGVFHIFYDRGEIETNYQKKKLFGGQEALDKIDLNISGLGAAVLLIEAGFPELSFGKTVLSLGLRKVFALPWGYKKFFKQDSPSISIGTGTLSLVKSVLLSGLSIRGSLSW